MEKLKRQSSSSQSAETKEKTGKTLFLIRHGESKYNSEISRVNEQFVGEERVKKVRELRFSLELIDPSLTDEGERQAKELTSLLKNKKVGLVITSPMRRCLQTTRCAFSNHQSKPKMIVLPLLKEHSLGTCDIPDDIKTIESDFPEFDYFLLNDYSCKELWFVDMMENEEQKKAFYTEMERDGSSHAAGGIEKVHKIMTQEMVKAHPIAYESLEDLNKRVDKIKKWRKEQLRGVKDEESVVVVAHSYILQTFISKDGLVKLKTGEIYEHFLSFDEE